MLGWPDAEQAAHSSGLPAGANDHVAIYDALLRFAAGVDDGDADLIASAFAEDAVIDFGPCGRMLASTSRLCTGGRPSWAFSLRPPRS